jgi:hypothetical protein
MCGTILIERDFLFFVASEYLKRLWDEWRVMQGKPDIIPLRLPGKVNLKSPCCIGGDLWAARMDSAYRVLCCPRPAD